MAAAAATPTGPINSNALLEMICSIIIMPVYSFGVTFVTTDVIYID